MLQGLQIIWNSYKWDIVKVKQKYKENHYQPVRSFTMGNHCQWHPGAPQNFNISISLHIRGNFGYRSWRLKYSFLHVSVPQRRMLAWTSANLSCTFTLFFLRLCKPYFEGNFLFQVIWISNRISNIKHLQW